MDETLEKLSIDPVDVEKLKKIEPIQSIFRDMGSYVITQWRRFTPIMQISKPSLSRNLGTSWGKEGKYTLF